MSEEHTWLGPASLGFEQTVCHTAVASELASLASCSPSSTPPFSASETWLGFGLGFGLGLGLGLGSGQG